MRAAQLVDSHTRSFNESDYIAYAKRLVKHCVVKKKGEAAGHLRHAWPVSKKPGRFLSAAVEGMRRQLDLPEYALEGALEPPPSKRRRRGLKKGSSNVSMLGLVKMLPHTLILPRSPPPATSRQAPSKQPSKQPPLLTMMRAIMWARPAVGAAKEQSAAPSLDFGRRPKLVERASARSLTREEACVKLFERWATPIYSDVDPMEKRLIEHSYVGNRRHPDDTLAVRLSDLALLLSDAGVALGGEQHDASSVSSGEAPEKGLPQLLALYHCLDYDGDGWITQADFSFAILQSTIDPAHPERGPLLPPSLKRGGSNRQHSQGPRAHHAASRYLRETEARRGLPPPKE